MPSFVRTYVVKWNNGSEVSFENYEEALTLIDQLLEGGWEKIVLSIVGEWSKP